jgi:hypothetical protein
MNIKQKFMKNLKVYKVLTLCILAVACSEDDKVTLKVQDTVERGAILRTVSTAGASWDVLDPSSEVTIIIEEQDDHDGALLQEVRVFADVTDNTAGNSIDPAEIQLATIPGSAFDTGPNGLPRTTFSTTLGDVGSALGISQGDYNCGDQVNLRMELALTDGRTFSAADAGSTVSGGSFFVSPFLYNISLIAPLPSDDLFTGQYQLTTVTPGIYGVSDYADGTYTLETINNTTKVIRNVTTFPAFGGFGPVDVQFQLVCGEIILTAGQSVGAGCVGTIFSGPAAINATYDLENPDDTDFVINFTSDETSDCTSAVQAAIRLVKL